MAIALNQYGMNTPSQALFFFFEGLLSYYDQSKQAVN